MITRRNFIGLILGAPAIVRASSLMPLVIRRASPIVSIDGFGFWQWSDLPDVETTRLKLRVIGISENFLHSTDELGLLDGAHNFIQSRLKEMREAYESVYGPYTEIQRAEDGLL